MKFIRLKHFGRRAIKGLNKIRRRFFKIFFNKYLLVFLIVFAVLFICGFVFVVREIRIVGVSEMNGLSKIYNKNIFLLKLNEIEESLYTANPLSKSIILSKSYPQKIIIKVEQDEPVGKLRVSDGFFVLSSSGRIIFKDESATQYKHLPEIIYFQKIHYKEYKTGEVINLREIECGLYFISKLKDIGISVDTVDISNGNMIVLKSEEQEYIVTTERDASIQYAQLKSIVERLTIKGTSYRRVDLRFQKPIVTF